MEVKLTDICDIQYGYAFDSTMFSETEGVPLVRIRDVLRGFSETRTTESFPPEYIVHNDDILIGMDGEFNIARWHGGNAALNQRVCRLIPKAVDTDYIFHFMPSALKAIEDKTPFVTVKHLSAKELNKITVPFPAPEVQIRIGTILNHVLQVIDARQRELQALDNLIKARFVELFGDFDVNEKGFFKATLQELIDKKFIMYHLDGNHGGDYPRVEEFVDFGVPYIGANCIVHDAIDFSLAKHLTEERAAKLRKGIAKDDDVLFAHNATVGPAVVLKTDEPKVILSTSLTAFRCDKHLITPRYLRAYLLCDYFTRQYMHEMKQTTRNQVPITTQRKYLFVVPPLELQMEFERVAEQIDKSKFAVQQALEKAQLLFDSLMQKYFE